MTLHRMVASRPTLLHVATVPLCSMTTMSPMIISRLVYLGLEWVLE